MDDALNILAVAVEYMLFGFLLVKIVDENAIEQGGQNAVAPQSDFVYRDGSCLQCSQHRVQIEHITVDVSFS